MPVLKSARTGFCMVVNGCRVMALMVIVMLCGMAPAATITVYKNGDNGAGTLRQALQDASAGDTIDFSITGTITVTSTLIADQDVIISGPGARSLYIVGPTPAGAMPFPIVTVISATITLSGLTIANADYSGVFNVSGTVTIRDCTLSGNRNVNGSGGGVYNAGTLTMNRCTVTGNLAGAGGGINSQGTLILNNCTISDNTASNSNSGGGGGGGGIYTQGAGHATINSCTIAGNSSTTVTTGQGGGGIRSLPGGTVTITNTIVSGNNSNQIGRDVCGDFESGGYNLIRIMETGAASGFGATGDQSGTVNSPINANLSPLQDNGGPTDTCIPRGNSPAKDQGKRGSLSLDQRVRPRPYDDPGIPNAVGGDGSDIGAVEVHPATTLVVRNLNDSGVNSLREAIMDAAPGDTIVFADGLTGAISLTSGRLVVPKSMTIAGPGADRLTVSRSGAAGTPDFSLFSSVSDGSVVVSGLTIAGGRSSMGSGITNFSGTLTLIDCTVAGNRADIPPGEGGGIYNYAGATVALTNCTFIGNHAVGTGGGVSNNGTLSVANCTFNRNTAPTGGGIANAGPLTLRSSTLSGNSDPPGNTGGAGGGIFNLFSAATHIDNSIFAGNTHHQAGPDVHGVFTSDGYNLIGIDTGAIGFVNGTNGNKVGTSAAPLDAKLGPLRNNGGPGETMALLAGSPAIDAGKSALNTDQRGLLRPYDHPGITNAAGGDGSDIGAMEVRPAPTVLPRLTITKSGPSIRILLSGEAGRAYQLQSSPNPGLYFANDGVPQTTNAAGQAEFTYDPLTPRGYYRAFGIP